jgi:hypothetical protein
MSPDTTPRNNGLLRWLSGVAAGLAVTGILGLIVLYGDQREIKAKVEAVTLMLPAGIELRERIARIEAQTQTLNSELTYIKGQNIEVLKQLSKLVAVVEIEPRTKK